VSNEDTQAKEINRRFFMVISPSAQEVLRVYTGNGNAGGGLAVSGGYHE